MRLSHSQFSKLLNFCQFLCILCQLLQPLTGNQAVFYGVASNVKISEFIRLIICNTAFSPFDNILSNYIQSNSMNADR